MKFIILIAVIAAASAEIIDPQVVCGVGEEKVCPLNPCNQNTCAGLLSGIIKTNLCTPTSGNDQVPCADGGHKLCRCLSGYARNANNVCVPKDKCCPAAQSFTTCRRTCRALLNDKECETTSYPVCGCDAGTYFNAVSNTCVTADRCPSVDPNPNNKCCKSDCDENPVVVNVYNTGCNN